MQHLPHKEFVGEEDTSVLGYSKEDRTDEGLRAFLKPIQEHRVARDGDEVPCQRVAGRGGCLRACLRWDSSQKRLTQACLNVL